MKSRSQLTIADARAKLRAVGMTLTRDTVGSGPTGSGEYRVSFNRTAWPTLSKRTIEATSYETPDLEDALRTGLSAANRLRVSTQQADPETIRRNAAWDRRMDELDEWWPK